MEKYYEKQGRLEEATEQFKIATKLDPGVALARHNVEVVAKKGLTKKDNDHQD